MDGNFLFLTYDQFQAAVFGLMIIGLAGLLWAWRKTTTADSHSRDIIIQQAARYPSDIARLHDRITANAEKHAKERAADMRLNGALRQETRQVRQQMRELQDENRTLRNEITGLNTQQKKQGRDLLAIADERDAALEQVRILTRERDEARRVARQLSEQLKQIKGAD